MFLLPLLISIVHMKLFQQVIASNKAIVTNEGLAIGTMISQRYCQSLAPSILAL